jgi:hypothetical protein
MAFTSSDLAAVDAAIASGELTVSHNGRTVSYRSMGDLLKAKETIQAEIAASQPGRATARTGYFSFSTSRERY